MLHERAGLRYQPRKQSGISEALSMREDDAARNRQPRARVCLPGCHKHFAVHLSGNSAAGPERRVPLVAMPSTARGSAKKEEMER